MHQVSKYNKNKQAIQFLVGEGNSGKKDKLRGKT